MNKLFDELATVALAQHDAELRFHALAARGSDSPCWISSTKSSAGDDTMENPIWKMMVYEFSPFL